MSRKKQTFFGRIKWTPHPPAAGSIEMKLELSCKDEKEVYDDFVLKKSTFTLDKKDFKSLQEMVVVEVATGGRAKSHTTCGVEDNKMIPAVYNEGKAIQECLPLTEESGLFGGKGVYRVNPRARIRIETTLGIGKPTEKFLTYPQTGSEIKEGKHDEYGELIDPPVAIPIHTYILESEMTVGISCTIKGDCDYSSDSPMDKKFLLVLEESVEYLNKKVAGMKDSLSEEFMKKYFKGDEFQVLQFIIDRAHYAPTTNGYTYKGVLTFTQPVEAYGKEDLYGTKGIPIVKGARFPLNIDGKYTVTGDWFRKKTGSDHFGFDIASSKDTIASICKGKVLIARFNCKTDSGCLSPACYTCGSCGNDVLVQCDPVGAKALTIRVWYLHLTQEDRYVQKGDTVNIGTPLGKSDHTGKSSGAHLHIHAGPKSMTSVGDKETSYPLNCIDWDKGAIDVSCKNATTKKENRK